MLRKSGRDRFDFNSIVEVVKIVTGYFVAILHIVNVEF